MRLMGEGCGELQEELCIAVGTFARYCTETGKGRDITYEEAMRILQRAEDNGYVHQITNIDGENKIFAICNCALGSCFALRCSTRQIFPAAPIRRRLTAQSASPAASAWNTVLRAR